MEKFEFKIITPAQAVKLHIKKEYKRFHIVKFNPEDYPQYKEKSNKEGFYTEDDNLPRWINFKGLKIPEKFPVFIHPSIYRVFDNGDKINNFYLTDHVEGFTYESKNHLDLIQKWHNKSFKDGNKLRLKPVSLPFNFDSFKYGNKFRDHERKKTFLYIIDGMVNKGIDCINGPLHKFVLVNNLPEFVLEQFKEVKKWPWEEFNKYGDI